MVLAERSLHSANTDEMSTVVWIGPTDGPCVRDAFGWVLANATQVCVRATVKKWEQRPAVQPSHLIVVRNRRVPIRKPLEAFKERLPHVHCLSLLGPECEGEARTGAPWPGFLSCPWHRWQQVLPNWLPVVKNARAIRSPLNNELGSSLVIGIAARQRNVIDEALDLCQQQGHTAIWVNDFVSTGPRNLDAMIWDDSLAPPVDRVKWRARIALGKSYLKASRQLKHCWLVSFPRPEDWRAAQRAGVQIMLSKPFAALALVNWLRER